ncbi:MAG TPA: DUF2189 domain-containing protein [Methylocella sp.]|nr:DUF2189 domain-containing protein [Methylocella sp.]
MNAHTIARPEVSPAYPLIRKIGLQDLKQALTEGVDDFLAKPSHLVFLGLIYPIAGIWLVVDNSLPLLFPLLSGFALIGPFAAIGLYEMSRCRELGLDTSWKHAFAVVWSHRMFPILSLGLILLVIFACWLFSAQSLYATLFGPAPPQSFARFMGEVFGTPQGWKLIGFGTAIGFVFAVLSLSVSVVSFPMLLDLDVDVPIAILTSIKAVLMNPFVMALWGLIVAASLAIGFLLVFAGLAVVVPVLAHATWHLYRKVVVAPASHG